MVVPSLTALLPDSPRQVIGHLRPFLSSINVDQLKEEVVLDVGPRPFDQVWV